jgi:drug/metabolite transporter (DMT)-like permease
MRKISWRRIVFFVVVVALSIAGGYYLGDDIRAAEKPNEYIAVIFSILAASLFAVVSIVGDPGMLPSGSSATAWTNARELQKQLHVFNGLFLLYIFTLGLLVASEVIEHAKWEWLYWVTNVYAGFAIAGFLMSFALPFDFMALQERRMEQEINLRSSRNRP